MFFTCGGCGNTWLLNAGFAPQTTTWIFVIDKSRSGLKKNSSSSIHAMMDGSASSLDELIIPAHACALVCTLQQVFVKFMLADFYVGT